MPSRRASTCSGSPASCAIPAHVERGERGRARRCSATATTCARFVDVTIRNDGLVAEMAERADALDRPDRRGARRGSTSRTPTSSTSLTEGDRKLRVARDIVDRAQEFGAAIAAVELARAQAEGRREPRARRRATAGPSRSGACGAPPRRCRRRWSRPDASRRPPTSAASTSSTRRASRRSPTRRSPPRRPAAAARPGRRSTDWVERLLKVYSTEQRALHDEVAELLTYSVQAGETEQATQNIAIETLKLGSRTAAALASRDTAAAAAHPRREPGARARRSPRCRSRRSSRSEMIDAHRPVAERARHHDRRPERAEPHPRRDGRDRRAA